MSPSLTMFTLAEPIFVTWRPMTPISQISKISRRGHPDCRYRNGAFGAIVDNFDEQAGMTVSFDEYLVGMPGQ